MGDIKSKKVLFIKGGLFLVGGIISSLIILLEHFSIKLGLLLICSIWCFARAYYFAFYVIEHYIDSDYKFAGLGSFVMYCLKKKKKSGESG